MKKIFFFVVLIFFFSSVIATVPIVDFNFYPSLPLTFSNIIFDPAISSDIDLDNLMWSGFEDGNINYFRTITFKENFSDGDYTNNPVWTVGSGTWSVGTNYRLTSNSTTNQYISTPFDLSFLDKNTIWQFDANVDSVGSAISLFLSQDVALQPDGYAIQITGQTSLKFLKRSGGGSQSTIIDTGFTPGTNQVYKLQLIHGNNNKWWIKINGVLYGTASGTTEDTFNDFNYFVVSNVSGTAGIISIDDINLTVGFPEKDKNETVFFTIPESKTVCLTAGNQDGNSTSCKSFSVSDYNQTPVITDFNFFYEKGFDVSDTNEHIRFRCDSNTSVVNMKTYFNGSIVYDQNTSPNKYYYVDVNANPGTNSGSFLCRTSSSFSDSESKNFNFFSVTFRIVNERTGLVISSFSDFNFLRLTSYDLNNFYDFNVSSKTEVTISSGLNDSVRLDINYSDGTIISKEFSLGLFSDSNIGLCVASPPETFAQQFFVSSQREAVVLQNAFSNCYALADYTKFAYLNNLMNKTYTISMPYYLYFYDDGVKSLLSTVDGETASITNLKALILNREPLNIDIKTDTLAISALANQVTGEYDSNVMQIYYYSLSGNNTQVSFKIYNESELLFSYIESESPNEIILNWDFNNVSGISSEDLLKIVATKTITDGSTSTQTAFFTINTITYGNTLSPGVAVAIAFFLFLSGITLFSLQFSFSWFGILLGLLSMAILAAATAVWWVVFFQAIILILTAYIFLLNAKGFPKVS